MRTTVTDGLKSRMDTAEKGGIVLPEMTGLECQRGRSKKKYKEVFDQNTKETDL